MGYGRMGVPLSYRIYYVQNLFWNSVIDIYIKPFIKTFLLQIMKLWRHFYLPFQRRYHSIDYMLIGLVIVTFPDFHTCLLMFIFRSRVATFLIPPYIT